MITSRVKQHLIFGAVLLVILCIPAIAVKVGVIILGTLGYIVYRQTQA